jgi:Protein-glutamine gamma-glutamyltransferase
MTARVFILLVLSCCAGAAQAEVQFYCPTRLNEVRQGVAGYLQALKIPSDEVVQTGDEEAGVLTLALTTPADDTLTLDLYTRPEYALSTEQVRLPSSTKGKMRLVNTVSRKEIMLAMLQHGRTTVFKGESCSAEALADRVGVRQNIVAWAERLEWDWPDGGPARWNRKYWNRGTPNPGVSLHAAVMDAFTHQSKYAMGCYTATKLVIVQGVLDYYSRVKHDPVRTRKVEQALLADGDPLMGIEPGSMWSFEKDFDPHDASTRGKLLKLRAEVAPGNFVPGDWSYILNTDPVSEQKTGYEGSNAVYLGRNRFDDYYNDNNHSYTYEQKLDEVYQWRNGVFSRSRDADKIRLLTPEQQALLTRKPEQGGLQVEVRAVPRYF